MPLHTYPKANNTAQWFDDNYSWTLMNPDCGVLHTTEGFGFPPYKAGSEAPTITLLPNCATKTVSFHQHFYDEHSARALVNQAGGVETNKANAVQIELVGTCDSRNAQTWGTKKVNVDYIYWPEAPDWALRPLAEWMVYCYKTHGIPLKSGLTFKAFPWGEGVRMSFDQWRNFTGWCGHQHVPENTHGDPGAFPIARVLKMAQDILSGGTTTTPAPIEEIPMAIGDDILRELREFKTQEAGRYSDLAGRFINQAAQIGGLTAALAALSNDTDLSAEEITAAAQAGAKAALDEKIADADVSLNVTPA